MSRRGAALHRSVVAPGDQLPPGIEPDGERIAETAQEIQILRLDVVEVTEKLDGSVVPSNEGNDVPPERELLGQRWKARDQYQIDIRIADDRLAACDRACEVHTLHPWYFHELGGDAPRPSSIPGDAQGSPGSRTPCETQREHPGDAEQVAPSRVAPRSSEPRLSSTLLAAGPNRAPMRVADFAGIRRNGCFETAGRVCALGYDPARLDHHDAICGADRTQAVTDDEPRASCPERLNALQDERFALPHRDDWLPRPRSGSWDVEVTRGQGQRTGADRRTTGYHARLPPYRSRPEAAR